MPKTGAKTKRRRTVDANGNSNSSSNSNNSDCVVTLPPKRARNMALARLANTHCLCGRKNAHGGMLCRELLEIDEAESESSPATRIAQTLIGFVRCDGGIENTRKLEDARLATLMAPFVLGRAHATAPGRWFCVSPPPLCRWTAAEDDGAEIMRILNDCVLPAVTRLRQHCSATLIDSVAVDDGSGGGGGSGSGSGMSGASTDYSSLSEYHRSAAEKLLREIESTLRKHDSRRRIIRELALLPGVYDPDFEERLDANTSLLGFDNCVFDLTSGAPREARATDYLSRSTHLQFPLDARADNIAQRPTVQRILWRLRAAMPRDDELQYLLHVLVSCFVGERSDLLHVWLGGGANMKTQCVRLIKSMLGSDYFAEIEPEMLTRARPSTACAAPDILMLAHKRCVCLSEICAREQLRTALLKRLTGDETLVARDLYSRRMVAVQPIATWLLLSNHDVDIAHSLDERHAIARRVRRLYFRVRFEHGGRRDERVTSDNEHSNDPGVSQCDTNDNDQSNSESAANSTNITPQSELHSDSDLETESTDAATRSSVPVSHGSNNTRRAVPKAVLDREFAAGAADFAAYLLLVVLPRYRALQRSTGIGLPSVKTIAEGTRAYLEQFDPVLEWFRVACESGLLRRLAETPPVAESATPPDLWRLFRAWLAESSSNSSSRSNSGGGTSANEESFRQRCPRRQAFQSRIDELLGETAVSCGARRYRYLHWQLQRDAMSEGDNDNKKRA